MERVIKNIVFDLGGVIMTLDPAELCAVSRLSVCLMPSAILMLTRSQASLEISRKERLLRRIFAANSAA